VVGDYDPLPGLNFEVTDVAGGSGAGGSFLPGDFVTVHFTVKTDTGQDLDLPSLDSGSIYVSGPTFNYQRVLASKSDLRTASLYAGAGVWSYTFESPIPATYLPPVNDSASFGPGDGELSGQPLLDGTYTVGIQGYRNYDVDGDAVRDPGVGIGHFLLGAAVSIEPREVVANANCNACHTEVRAHGGGRIDVRLCVLCHTSGAEDRNVGSAAGGTPGVSVDFRVMIHKIHNGAHLPSVLGIATNADGTRDYAAAPAPYEVVGFNDTVHDYSGVNFPVWPNLNIAMPKDAGYSALPSSARSRDDATRTGVTACAKCHGDPDGAGPASAPAQGDLYRLQPSRRACGSCHDDVDWTKPYTANLATMPAQPDDSGCAVCHSGSGGSLPTDLSHRHPLVDPSIDPGVHCVITQVTGGTLPNGNFQVGDVPTATFTLKNDAGADIGLSTVDASTSMFLGPTTNRQLITPLTSPNGQTLSPYDFSGRLHAVSGTNKGTMSKVSLGVPAAAETLVVEFTSATAFAVSGTASGALGSGALPASPSTNPSGSSVAALELGPALGTGTVQVTFSDATHFTLTGAVTGAGTLPAATNASTRFTSPNLSFNVSVGTTPFAAGNTVNVALFRGGPANPVLFAIVGGRTAFSAAAGARDRFVYEVVPDAPSYVKKLPMDLVLEHVGSGSGVAGQTLTPGNLPVHYGRQQLWEAATTATTTTTVADVAALGRFVDVAPATGFANGDTVVIDPAAGIGVREYVQVAPARADGVIAAAGDTTVRLHFKTPLRYAHGWPVTVTKVTLTFKQEGAANAYGLATDGSGLVTSLLPFTSGAGLVMTYRTDARFGWKRHAGDAFQAYYVPPANDSPDLAQDQGDWQALPYLDGTYTADLWFAKNVDLGLQDEVQTYRSTSNAATKDFLYGGASVIVPRAIISASENCYACHDDVIFHGGGRRGVDACLTCHAVSGSEDKPRWDTPKVSGTATDTALTPGVAIEFRQMLHKIHKGEELTFAATYTVVGNGGNPHTYGEVVFPAIPGGVRQCVKCHGNDAWKQPAPRVHPFASVPTRAWGVVCGACHDSTAAHAHIDVNTVSGVEGCDVCHGPGQAKDVVKVHFPR
jgi:OmcA/MtrC family decaheme c-type cytochrome